MFLRLREDVLRRRENLLHDKECFRSPGENVFRPPDYYLPRRDNNRCVSETFLRSGTYFLKVYDWFLHHGEDRRRSAPWITGLWPAQLSLHFSPVFYCGGGSGHVYCVALGRAPRHTVVYVCGALGRAGWKAPDAPCIHARLRRLATKTGEKCGLAMAGSFEPGCT